jgi:hypothetical protein
MTLEERVAAYARVMRETLWQDCQARHYPQLAPDRPWRPLAEIAVILDRWLAAGTLSCPACYDRRQAIVDDLLYADRWRDAWGQRPSGPPAGPAL